MIKRKKAIMIVCVALLMVGAAFFFAYRMQEQNSAPDGVPDISGDTGVFGDNVVVYDSSNGEILIEASRLTDDSLSDTIVADFPAQTIDNPENIWENDVYAGNHTPAEKVQFPNGSIGILTILKLDLAVNVYESLDNMEAMSKGIAHFPATSAFDGNIGLSAHNKNLDGSDGYFKDLHTLELGDCITYTTTLGERYYTVTSITTIDENDWTSLYYTDDNRVTLITCISGQPTKRLCVQAVEASA